MLISAWKQGKCVDIKHMTWIMQLIHMRRFGNVLFENPAEASMRFLTPPLYHHFSAEKLHDYISTSKGRHIFFPRYVYNTRKENFTIDDN